MRQAFLVSVLFGLAVGCSKGSTAPATSGDSAPGPSTVASTSTDAELSQARRLAFAAPNGQGEVDKIILTQQARVQKTPEATDPWILLGRGWIRKARESADPGYYLNARACADEVLDLDPGDRLALGLQSQVMLNDHRFGDARDMAEKALAKEPSDLVALSVESDALLELGRFEEATAAAQKMMDIKPNLPSYIRASYLRWLVGDDEAAKEAAKHAILAGGGKDPEPVAWATVQAAVIFWHEGDLPGADAGFDRALTLFADYPPALVGKAQVAIARGEGAKAADLLDKAYKASPLVQTAWLLGDARSLAGDRAGAKEAYERVTRRGRQSDPRALSLYYSVKNLEPAEALRLALEEKKTRGDLYTEDALAWALYRNGKFAEAKAESDRATRLGTKDALLMYHAGAIKLALGDKAGGEKQVREALKLNPRFDMTGADEAAKLVGADKH